MQDASTLSQYAPGVDAGDLVDGFGEIFSRYEIPIGLMAKLQVGQPLPPASQPRSPRVPLEYTVENPVEYAFEWPFMYAF